jgi:hypothetical protein
MIGAFLGLAVARGGEAFESETVAQARHDLFGQPIFPAFQYFRSFQRAGPVDIAAYLGGEWAAGLDQPMDPEVYLLEASGSGAWGRWSLGRQQALTLVRPQTFDGARVEVLPNDSLQFEAWAGLARHHDLDDLRDGTAMARAGGRMRAGIARIAGGVELDEDSDEASADVEAGVRAAGDMAPEARGLVAVAGSDLRWARLALSGDLMSGARLTLDGQRRTLWDRSDLLGEALVAPFAESAVDSLGAEVRLSDRRWARWAFRYSFDTYEQVDERVHGHAVDASYAGGATRAALTVAPAYRFRSGPGGVFHAAYATARLDAADALALGATLGFVPYRKLHDPWATAVAGGLSATADLGGSVALTAGADASSDAVYALDVRGYGVLRVAL